MDNYVIFTDSACDMESDTLKKWNVKFIDLTLKFDGEDKIYKNSEVEPVAFYNKMREGGVAKTSAVNSQAFKLAFEEELKNGNDIFYLGFSSGLSTTYNSGASAAKILSEAYPDRKILTVDSLAASAGFGLLVYLAVKKKEEGASIEELAKYMEEIKWNMCHWFTVDDLVYLKRGGRVSAAAALVGGMLGIKPVLHVDNEGHLINTAKVRGRKASIKALFDKYKELAIDPTKGPIYICQGDCKEDADMLSNMIKEEFGPETDMTVFTGPVVGAHSGPGTLALFFLGKER